LVGGEGVEAAVFEGIEAGFGERLCRHGEGDFVDGDKAQCFAGNIHALPEAMGAEQDRRCLDKGFEQSLARPTSLQEGRDREFGGQILIALLHLAKARKQSEGTSAEEGDEGAKLIGEGLGEGRGVGGWHMGGQIEGGLF